MAPFIRHSPVAAAALLSAACSWAQSPATAPATTQLAPVTVSGRAEPAVGVAGWGELPLSKLPMQASVYSAEQIADKGVQRLSDLIGFDPALGDAYNSEGYWDFLTVRGFVLDNRFNFRRDDLPINAETSIPLDNKARVEVLKGLSGMQAGTSAPGGLVNYVVKRPGDAPIRSASVEWRQHASVTGTVDLGQRFGVDNALGLRLNAALAHLDPQLRDARGKRSLLALAGDWRLSPDTLLEAEVETSHRSQPSQPGFSLLGNNAPDAHNIDPRINLNNQPWSLPVVFDATTASLRWQQRLSADWQARAHLATQRLRTDDRVAFPFGCTDPNGTYYADRFCPDGSFDLYDFRSENEHRRSDALDLSLSGTLQTGPLGHLLTTGVLRSNVRNRFQQQAFNFAGTGNITGTAITPAAPALTDENTNRDERSTEWYLRDALSVNEQLTAWLGLRHTQLKRQSVRTDGSRPTDYGQSFTTPWLAVSYAISQTQRVYASWGQGIESEVAPNRTRYINRGEALPALKSRQIEVGLKGSNEQLEWGFAWFDIQRPVFADIGTCDVDNSCTRQVDGNARHRGAEATAATRIGPWLLRGGAQWLRARREGSQDVTLDGLEPTNVSPLTLRLQVGHAVAAVPGLTLTGHVTHEDRRVVLPDNSAGIPGYSRIDADARYEAKIGTATVTWRAGIDNLFDQRAWKESPYQFGHAYLFPLAPRTLRLSVQAGL
jgi:iron complex outermembrane recepter protein